MKETNKVNVVSIRLVKDAPLMSKSPITMPEDVVKLIGEQLCELDREVICVINLDGQNTPVNCSFVSMGAVNETTAHPREILKAGILSNAASMIVIHNHPSGSLNPSKEDCMTTDRLVNVCSLVGIPLLDHIIVGGDNSQYFSFKEKGVLPYGNNKYVTDYQSIEFEKSMVAESKAESVQRNHRHR